MFFVLFSILPVRPGPQRAGLRQPPAQRRAVAAADPDGQRGEELQGLPEPPGELPRRHDGGGEGHHSVANGPQAACNAPAELPRPVFQLGPPGAQRGAGAAAGGSEERRAARWTVVGPCELPTAFPPGFAAMRQASGLQPGVRWGFRKQAQAYLV